MKTLLLTLGLVTLAASSHGQGTIQFGNGTLTRVLICSPSGYRGATAVDGLMIGAFYGPAGSQADALQLAPGTASIGPVAGVMINAPSVFALPGTDGGQVVSLQIRMWEAALGTDGWRQKSGLYGETKVAQVTLGPTAGPGAVIWQTATGTIETRFTPLVTPLTCVPEPSTYAIAALGGLLFLIVRRKPTTNQ